jgi:hypothetical protein
MNLGQKHKTLINAGENTDVELPLDFSNNTTPPIILTESDSIIIRKHLTKSSMIKPEPHNFLHP